MNILSLAMFAIVVSSTEARFLEQLPTTEISAPTEQIATRQPTTTTRQPMLSDGSCIDGTKTMRRNGETWIEKSPVDPWINIDLLSKENRFACENGTTRITKCRLFRSFISVGDDEEIGGRKFTCTPEGIVEIPVAK